MFGSSSEAILSAECFTFTLAGASSRAGRLGYCKCLGELPSIHRRRADIAGLAALDDIVQRFDCLLDRGFVIPAMDLVEVDVIHAEPVQAGVDLAHDCLARQAAAVRTGAHPAIYFGRDDHLVAAGQILDSPSEDLLAA